MSIPITRRSLLQGSTSTLLAASPILTYTPPRISQRGLVIKGTNALKSLPLIPEAIYTNDDGSFYNAGTVKGMPTVGRYILVSYLWNSYTLPSPTASIFLIINKRNNPSISIAHFAVTSGIGLGAIVTEESPTPNVLLLNSPVNGNISYDGYWHWNIMHIDTQSCRITAMTDGHLIGATTGATTPFEITLAGNEIYVADTAVRTGLTNLIFAALDSPLDITDPNVIAAFRDPFGAPVRQPTNGQIAIIDTSSNVLRNIQAQIVLSGSPDEFPRNFPGWTFEAGAAAQDSSPSSQFQTRGNVSIPPFADPWGT